MAFIDGKHQGSSVTRALARHRLDQAKQSVNQEGGHQPGDGEEVTIKKGPNGFHTTTKHHDGHTEEADHQDFDSAVAHAGSHLGAQHSKPMREKNTHRKKMEGQQPEEPTPEPAMAGLEGIGVSDGE